MDLEKELKDLTTKLEGKSKEQADTLIKAFEVKHKEEMTLEIKTAVDAVKAESKEVTDEMQKHLDKLDIKLQAKDVQGAPKVDILVKAIKDNSEGILNVKKGQEVQTKVVGDMTTGNLTGDEPRDYNFDIVNFPSQKVNISDLARNISIGGGTYTYTRETGAEGAIGDQTEGASKNQVDYDFATVDVSTNFIAGFTRYSRKMRNNLSYITSSIPMLLRRDYFKAENAAFQLILAADATASTEIITGKTKAEMLINEIGKLEDSDYTETNLIVVKPTDYLSILKTAKADLASAVTYEGGVLRVAGVQVLKGSSWLPANKYYIGDWSRVSKINTEGLSLAFSEEEGTNFVKNMITARIESQTALTVEQPAALVYGDFTAV
jgi:HK97 family phage major capsid protein